MTKGKSAAAFSLVMCEIFIGLPQLTVDAAGNAAWLCVILAAAILFFMMKLVSDSNERVRALLFTVTLALIQAVITARSAQLVNRYSIHGFSQWLFIALCAVICFVSVFRSNSDIYNVSVIVVSLLSFCLLLIFTVAVNQYDIYNLFPIINTDASGIVTGTVYTFALLSPVAIILCPLDKAAIKPYSLCVGVFTAALLMLMLSTTYAVIDSNESTVIELAKNISLRSFFERMESVCIFAAVCSVFLSNAVLSYTISNCCKVIARKGKILTFIMIGSSLAAALFFIFTDLSDTSKIVLSVISVLVSVLFFVSLLNRFAVRHLAAGALALVLAFLTSCGYGTAVEDKTFTMAVGVDVCGSDEFEYTIVTMNSKDNVVKCCGQNMSDALERLNKTDTRTFDLTQTELFIISEECAGQIDVICERICKSNEMKNSASVLICSGKTSEYFSIKDKEWIDATARVRYIENYARNDNGFFLNSAGTIRNQLSKYGCSLTGYCRIKGNLCHYTGAFAVGEQNMILSGREAALYQKYNGRISVKAYDKLSVSLMCNCDDVEKTELYNLIKKTIFTNCDIFGIAYKAKSCFLNQKDYIEYDIREKMKYTVYK